MSAPQGWSGGQLSLTVVLALLVILVGVSYPGSARPRAAIDVAVHDSGQPAFSTGMLPKSSHRLNPDAVQGHVAPLPTGVMFTGAFETYADSIPGYVWEGTTSGTCVTPSANTTTTNPVNLVTSSEVVCLNGIFGGVASTAWQANLTNFTTYQNGSTSISGCEPIPPFTNGTSCPFFASNRYTEYLPEWSDGVPANSTELWSPDQTGFFPGDLTFCLELSVNESAAPAGTTYSVTVVVTGATPVPLTFYVRTPASAGGGPVNLTVAFDTTVAWLSELNNSSGPSIYPTIGGFWLNMSYVSPAYPVQFTEAGLPVKALAQGWTIELDGDVARVTGTDASLGSLPNGSYSFFVRGPAGYRVFGSSPFGNLVVSGGAAPVSVRFVKGSTVHLGFAEAGLPLGQAWCIELGGWEKCSRIRAQGYANLTPGTYPYSVESPLSGQNITQKVGSTTTYGPTGPITLSRSTTVRLTFAYRYGVTFTEAGLTTGTWSLAIKGHTETGAWDQSIQFNLTNGTYTYKIGPESGYEHVGSPPKVMVNGATVSVTVTFTKKS